MDKENFENQLDETTESLISKMEKELNKKDEELQSKEN